MDHKEWSHSGHLDTVPVFNFPLSSTPATNASDLNQAISSIYEEMKSSQNSFFTDNAIISNIDTASNGVGSMRFWSSPLDASFPGMCSLISPPVQDGDVFPELYKRLAEKMAQADGANEVMNRMDALDTFRTGSAFQPVTPSANGVDSSHVFSPNQTKEKHSKRNLSNEWASWPSNVDVTVNKTVDEANRFLETQKNGFDFSSLNNSPSKHSSINQSLPNTPNSASRNRAPFQSIVYPPSPCGKNYEMSCQRQACDARASMNTKENADIPMVKSDDELISFLTSAASHSNRVSAEPHANSIKQNIPVGSFIPPAKPYFAPVIPPQNQYQGFPHRNLPNGNENVHRNISRQEMDVTSMMQDMNLGWQKNMMYDQEQRRFVSPEMSNNHFAVPEHCLTPFGTPTKGCVFCKNNNYHSTFYKSHTLKDDRGQCACPVLRAYVCPLCRGTGDTAHTLKYCPLNTVTRGDPIAAGLPPGKVTNWRDVASKMAHFNHAR